MARSDRALEIDGEGAFWAVAGFAVSLLVGVALRPLRESAGLENVVVVYVIVVALAAAIGGRMAGLATSLSAALAYNWFFTTPYETLRIDTAEQVATVVLLFVAGLRDLLDARAVRVVRDGPEGDLVVAQAGQPDGDLDLDDLPHLDEEGRIPSGHRRSVGGTLVLPAQGAVVDLVRRDRRVGALVIVPLEDRPILRSTRLGIAAAAHALAMVPDPCGGSSLPPRPPKSA
jgi:Domain of unknown function (DUF4118)